MLTNTDCTLYRYNKSTQGFNRVVIKDVYWCENRGAKVTKNGIQTEDGVTIYFYDIHKPKTPGKDMIVKGIVDFEFDNTSQATISASAKEFRILHPNFVTITAINDFEYGNLPHTEAQAR